MSYILLDESGDLGFSFDKQSSKYFVVTIIFTSNKRRLEKIARTVHKGLSKKYKKKIGVLHAYQEEEMTRRKLLRQLNNTDCAILAIILDKKKMYTKLPGEKTILYNYITNILLDRLFTKNPGPISAPITLIASQRETNRFFNENFKQYLAEQITNNHKIKIGVELPHLQRRNHSRSQILLHGLYIASMRKVTKAITISSNRGLPRSFFFTHKEQSLIRIY
jgi:hypothetical protein